MEMSGTAASLLVQLGIFLIGAYLAINGYGVTAGTTIIFVQLLNYVLNKNKDHLFQYFYYSNLRESN